MAAGAESVIDLVSVDVRMERIVHHAAGFRHKVCGNNRQRDIFTIAAMRHITRAV